MRSMRTCLLGLSCLVLLAAESLAEDRARRDVYGDPLPEGARARMGTARLRHQSDVRAFAFTPDGKALIGAEHWTGSVVFWDLASGRELRRLRTHLRTISSMSMSADGK